MKNQRALAICQQRYDAMLPDDYWDNDMDYDDEAPCDEGAEEEYYISRRE